MLSTWDLARPSFWHPMSMLEQPMMDLDTMADQILGSRFPMTTSMLVPPSMHEDDDFFRDLPVEQRGQRPAEKQPEQQREGNRAFSSYSSNSSSVVDGKGCRISSTRHRYEDSNGRLKAVHEREVDGKRLKTIWHCKDRDDQGEHKMLCSQGTPDEFEKVWSKTPFGQAQEKKNKELKEQGETGDQHQVQGTEGKSQIQEQQPMSKSAA
ncbi:hypothetical protein FI667_g5217, partial [Globisporangium splendens]